MFPSRSFLSPLPLTRTLRTAWPHHRTLLLLALLTLVGAVRLAARAAQHGCFHRAPQRLDTARGWLRAAPVLNAANAFSPTS